MIEDSPDNYVFSLIKGSRLHYSLQLPIRPPRSKELQERLQGIQNDLDNQAYLEMTKGVQSGCSTDSSKILKSSDQSNSSLGQELRAANAQLSAAINVFLSMAAVFTAAFYFGDQVTSDTGLRVLLALAGAWVVGIAEGYFFLKDLVLEEKGWEHTKGSSVG